MTNSGKAYRAAGDKKIKPQLYRYRASAHFPDLRDQPARASRHPQHDLECKCTSAEVILGPERKVHAAAVKLQPIRNIAVDSYDRGFRGRCIEKTPRRVRHAVKGLVKVVSGALARRGDVGCARRLAHAAESIHQIGNER